MRRGDQPSSTTQRVPLAPHRKKPEWRLSKCPSIQYNQYSNWIRGCHDQKSKFLLHI